MSGDGEIAYFDKRTTKSEDQTLTYTICIKVPNIIENILDNKHTHQEFRTSPFKDDAGILDARFQIKIVVTRDNNDLIKICFMCSEPLWLNYEMSLSHETIFSIVSRELVEKLNYKYQAGNKWIDLKPINSQSLISDPNHYLRGNNLLLKLEITVLLTDTPKLNTDFGQLLNSEMFADVTIISADKVEFKVHKAILCCRSDVLKSHFEHNTTECITNSVESHLESDVLKEVLAFIYTGNAPRLDEIPEKLLAAANFYQLLALKRLCEEALCQKLTVENAIEYLELAELYTADNLMLMTLEYIKNGQMNLVMKTEAWKKLKSPNVLKRICEHVVTHYTVGEIEYKEGLLNENGF